MITGGSRGIGRAIVDCFLQEGAAVLTCGRGQRPANLTNTALWVEADITDPHAVSHLVDTARETLGEIHILVNNAGIQIEKTIVDSTDEDWTNVIGTNAKGVFLCCRAFIPILTAAGGGSIINLGSISGQHADASMALYNASKAFVHGLTRSIAIDHGAQGIRCNAISPGWIMTEMVTAAFALADDPKAAHDAALARHPVGRLGTPNDIARTAVWLASDESTFASGQTYIIDGGLVAGSPLQPGLN
ncbi:MAG: SDR family oxidoreductase [Pseudomonadota bacterium]|nr:SDR family oxidoreductase [Pseudomonadota bacterium]